MSIRAHERPRVLLAAGAEQQSCLQALFTQEPLDQWQARAADSFAHARYLLQHNPCDLLIVNSDLVDREGTQGLAWLAFQRSTPVLFLGADQPEHYARSLECGVDACLPRTLACAHPPLLHAMMRQTLQAWELKHVHERTKDQLHETRRQVDRLVSMIWRMAPRQDDQWYSQRHMLERLDEELARCQRHQVPLSVAVGELQPAQDDTAPRLPDWSTDVIVRGKRRCDVVGQYGPNGFLLLMVHTPKPGSVTCCKRLQNFLEHPAAEMKGPHMPLRSYFGLASTVKEHLTPQSLLRIAEQNLETARARTDLRIVAE